MRDRIKILRPASSTPIEESNVTDGNTHPTSTRIVRHWGRIWLGKSSTVNGRYYIAWEPEREEVEVSVQQYGDPHWIEKLFRDMITVAREYLDEASLDYSTVRIRVNLYSHQSDGKDQKFTLEHMERR